VTVLGYGLLTTDAETLIDALNNQKFKVVIVDESHYMKSRTATRSKILLPVVQKATRAILLSGTPALGRPEEVLCCFSLGFKREIELVICFASFIFKSDSSNAKTVYWKFLSSY
jgi:SNF2 family DNA or RNA helicase